jgi:hypothetical protein
MFILHKVVAIQKSHIHSKLIAIHIFTFLPLFVNMDKRVRNSPGLLNMIGGVLRNSRGMCKGHCNVQDNN